MRVWAWQIEFFVFYLLVKPQGGFRTSSAGRAIQNLGQSKDADREEMGDDNSKGVFCGGAGKSTEDAIG